MRSKYLLLLFFFFSVNELRAVPIITSFSPASGAIGTVVTITGTNLDNPTTFTIGSTAAIIISGTSTQLVGMVMPGAITGTISLTNTGGTATSTGVFTVTPTLYPNNQQGSKLVGSGGTGAERQGYAVAISADGNTAIVGAYHDNNDQGAVWIFTRSGGVWSQQGNKLIGTGNTGAARQGYSVAISADGNTTIIGGEFDNATQGAAWIFTRSAGIWSQQGSKLVGTGSIGPSANQGSSVGISADGNTTIIGGNGDNSGVGAAWMFVRSGTTWSQQGNKLVGDVASYNPFPGSSTLYPGQGTAVGISADGSTAVIGGPNDAGGHGAVWVFTKPAGIWVQQGSKLTENDYITASFGRSLAISADGNTAVIGGSGTWAFTRNSGTWAQLGSLFSASNVSSQSLGSSVAISADGKTAITGNTNNVSPGAAWVFTQSGASWQYNSKLTAVATDGTSILANSLSLSADGTTAIIGNIGNNSGQGASWIFTALAPPTATTLAATNVTSLGATLNGTVNDNGSSTVVTMEYSNAADMSSSVTATLSTGTSPISPGTGNVNFSSIITGILPGYTFYYRINAVGNNSTVHGAILSFTTPAVAPIITSFTPTSALPGATVTVTGTNFTGVTAVSFGGVAATSFNVSSQSRLTAVVGSGATGSVSVTTPGGTATAAGFVFLGAPAITSFTPTTAITGTAVSITGTNFTGATVISFGGVPATSFTINSSTNITAVVAAGASGNVAVTTPGGTALLAGFNYTYILPANNFAITTISALCKGSNNGIVKITAVKHLNYTATISIGSLNTSYNFTDSLTVNNLTAGTYNVCFTVSGQSTYQQCFSAVITEPKDLSVYVASVKPNNEVVLGLGGGASYNISLNGNITTTANSQVILTLAKGKNTILVSTDKACQGIIEKEITISDGALVFPNPFDNTLNLNIGNSTIKKIDIMVYGTDGKVFYATKYNNASGILPIDLSKLNSGIYLLKLTADDSETVFKIIKKMNKAIIKIFALPILLLLVIGCKKPKDTPDPGKAILNFPAQNAACTTGTVISSTQSTIAFTWLASDNTDSYEVGIKNLLTNTITTLTATTNQLQVTLLRNTPYSWYVVSKSTVTTNTTKSEIWKFYNSGTGVISHPPFPADILTPTFAQSITASSGTINLTWAGADTDNDISGYDVYFGTNANPALLQANVTAMFLNNTAVTSGTTYYWKIITKDIAGNTSDSGIFQFKVN